MSGVSAGFEVVKSVCLKQFNTLALPATAQNYAAVTNIEQLLQGLEYSKQNQLQIVPLGEGSNLVLASDLSGLVMHIQLKGVTSRQLSDGKVEVTMAAGENWHSMVRYCLDRGWYGLENLGLIPGNVGAAPIQNIGAYGVELRDLLVSVDVVEIKTGTQSTLSCEQLEFSYRSSIFKQQAKDQYIILGITVCLSTEPVVNIEYPALRAELNGVDPTPEAVFEAVCRIRRNKLPDPNQLPNVGSFFKNPVIDQDLADRLAENFPDLPIYPLPSNCYKLPAAWLIESCGFRGKRRGAVGMHKHQALVLVNYQGDGNDVLALAEEVISEVMEKFSISLEIEPRVYQEVSLG